MEMLRLGKTRLPASRLGLGLAALGRPGYITLGHADDLNHDYALSAMRENAHDVLDVAFQGGIRFFDAARSYGRAEEFLAHWLRIHGHPHEGITIASKWGYTYVADWKVDAETHEIKDHSPVALQRQFEETRAILGRHLDLYQIHSASVSSGVLEDEQVLDELARIKAQGISIGLTVSGSDQSTAIMRALEIERDGVLLFDSVQATWNLLERSASYALGQAYTSRLGIIVKEALANGRLTEKNGDPAFAPKLAALREQARRLDTTVDALALAAALAQPWATVVLTGAATPEQMRSNLKAIEKPWDDLAGNMLLDLRETPEEYWRTRAALPWN